MTKTTAAPADSSGGDGAAGIDTTTQTAAPVTGLPAMPDASADQAALEAHIDAELGLPHVQTQTTGDKDDAGVGQPTPGADATGTDDQGASAGAAVAKDGEAVDAAAKVAEVKPEPAAKAADTKPVEAAVAPAELKLIVTDANGKEFTLKPGDNIDTALKDFVPTGTGQIMRVMGEFQQLNAKAEAATQAQAEAEEAAKTTAAQEAQQQAALAAWDAEIEALQTENRIGKPKVATTDPNYAKDPVVVRVDQVFKFMAAENEKRQAAGNPHLMRSFTDALDKLELQESRTAAAKAQTDGAATAKAKSALLSGHSASGTTGPEIIRPGQYKSVFDVPV